MPRSQIRGTLAGDQHQLFATLASGDFVKLAGEVARIDPGGLVLQGCRQAG